jgi:aspartyl-tRNA(Asn)/glutamyl-tRNA(Gln) amidotransferase subunit C
MSSIDLRQVARLARLHLTEQELKSLQSQVGQILAFVEKLGEVKGLEGVQPTSHPFEVSNVFRPDEPKASLPIEEFLKHSPQSKGRFFQVPKIIEGKE